MKKVLIANWNLSKEWLGGQESFFCYLSKALHAKQVSFTSASKVIGFSQGLTTAFAAVLRGRIIDMYLKEYEKIFPLNVIVKNSAVGGYLDLKTPIVTVFQDPYDTISKILYFYGYFLPHMEHYNACVDLQRKTADKSACNVAVSEFMQEYMKKIGVTCNKVINEGVDMQKFKPLDKKEALRKKYGIPLNKKVGLTVTKFHPAKGWHIFAELVREFKDIFWVIVFTEPVYCKIKSKNLKVFQMLPRNKMPELYNLADFFILPTACESFGLSSLESAACNLPIITQKTGVWWNFWDKSLGYRINEWEYKSYKEAVEKILDGNDKFSPRNVVEEKFSLNKWIEEWKLLIEGI